jgi:hypothetical protein
MRLLIATLALALSCTLAQAEEVYRTMQPDGTVVYSDRPLSPASVRLSTTYRHTDPEAVEAELQSLEQSAEERRGATSPADDFAAARAEQRELRAQACEEARRAAAAYEGAPRLYEELSGGGRRYLTDEEIVQARLSARQAVADFCDD